MFPQTHSELALQETKTPKRPPINYSDELADTICGRVAEGESLYAIGGSNSLLPGYSALYGWELKPEKYQYFNAELARARMAYADRLADEILDIADDSSGDIKAYENGTTRIDNEAVQRSKIKIDARKWKASTLSPQVYGDSTKIEVKGTIEHTHEIVVGEQLAGIMERMGVGQDAIEGECSEVSEDE